MPLQSPPFWWIDDNQGFAQGYNMKVKILRTTKYRRAPPECVHLVSSAFGMQDTHIKINTPPIFYSPTILSTKYMREETSMHLTINYSTLK